MAGERRDKLRKYDHMAAQAFEPFGISAMKVRGLFVNFRLRQREGGSALAGGWDSNGLWRAVYSDWGLGGAAVWDVWPGWGAGVWGGRGDGDVVWDLTDLRDWSLGVAAGSINAC